MAAQLFCCGDMRDGPEAVRRLRQQTGMAITAGRTDCQDVGGAGEIVMDIYTEER